MRCTPLAGLLVTTMAAASVAAAQVPADFVRGRGPLAEAALREGAAAGIVAASAQSASAAAVKQAARTIAVGKKVRLTLFSGETIDGKLVEASEAGLVLLRAGDRGYDNFGNKVRNERPPANVEIPYEKVEIVSVSERDSLVNGALIGLAIGAGAGAAAMAIAYAADTAGSQPDPEERNAFIAGGAVGGALWGVLFGTLADASRVKTTVVYRAPEGSRSAHVALFPVITPRAKVIAASISF